MTHSLQPDVAHFLPSDQKGHSWLSAFTVHSAAHKKRLNHPQNKPFNSEVNPEMQYKHEVSPTNAYLFVIILKSSTINNRELLAQKWDCFSHSLHFRCLWWSDCLQTFCSNSTWNIREKKDNSRGHDTSSFCWPSKCEAFQAGEVTQSHWTLHLCVCICVSVFGWHMLVSERKREGEKQTEGETVGLLN